MTGVTGVTGAFHDGVVFGRRVRRLGQLLAPLFPPGASVLDIGCGDGSVAAEIMSHRSDLTVEGVDVLVRPRTRIPVTAYDGHRLPFDDGTFDAACFVDVLHHTHDPAAVLAEAARVCTGPLVVKDHLTDGLLAVPTLRLMDRVGNARHGVALPYRYLGEHEWRTLLAGLGYAVDSWSTDLGLYAPPLSWWFARRLHVLFAASRCS